VFSGALLIVNGCEKYPSIGILRNKYCPVKKLKSSGRLSVSFVTLDGRFSHLITVVGQVWVKRLN
jgi:hypothetical protein